MAEPPVCPIHNTVLRISPPKGNHTGLYFYCKYADQGSGCPEYGVEEWRRGRSQEGYDELKKVADQHGVEMTPPAPAPPAPAEETKPKKKPGHSRTSSYNEQAKAQMSPDEGEEGSSRVIYELPETAAELDHDPRTSLDLVDLPEDAVKPLSQHFNDQSLLHLVVMVEKMNQNKKFEKRFLVISTYCMYIFHPNGTLARCLELIDIDRILTDGLGTLAFVVTSEFDSVLRSVEYHNEIVRIVSAVYKFKKKKDLEVETVDPGVLTMQANVKKPAHWRLEMKYVHSKAQLYRRLQQHNDRDKALDYLSMEKDPRTGLELRNIPRQYQHIFKATEFRYEREPLMHFFTQCSKVNHKLACDQRFCLVTNSNLYLSHLNGRIHRCVPIYEITAVLRDSQIVALKIPNEFDMMLTMQAIDVADELTDVLTALYKFKRGQDLPVQPTIDIPSLQLNKPSSGWKSTILPVLTRKDLVDHLRQNNIRPDDPPTVGDKLEPPPLLD